MNTNIKTLCAYTSKPAIVKENENFYCTVAEKEIARGVKMVFAAVVGQDDYVVLVTYDEHLEKNAINRSGSLATSVVRCLIRDIENNETLANAILNSEDAGYEKGKSHGTVAVHFKREDWLLYLCVKDGFIHISTLVRGSIFYVNPDSDLIVTVDNEGEILSYGIEGNHRMAESKGSKYKGGNGH